MSYTAPSCNFLCFFISRNKNKQATKLTIHVSKPTNKATSTPNFYLISSVKKTLAIYPISGKIKVKPANLPIQLDARLACII